MKKIIFSICLVVGVLAMSGCADFLERESYGKDETWKTQEDVSRPYTGSTISSRPIGAKRSAAAATCGWNVPATTF